MHPAKPLAAAKDNAVRPIHINVPEEGLIGLLKRYLAQNLRS
jgi:hypothetical protein